MDEEKTQLHQLEKSFSEKQDKINNLQSEVDFWRNDAEDRKDKLKNCKTESVNSMLEKQIGGCQGMVKILSEQLAQTREKAEVWQKEIKKLEPIFEIYDKEKQELELLNSCFQERKYDNILKKIKKECPICYGFMKPPVKIFQCSQGHWLCETCFEKTRETS